MSDISTIINNFHDFLTKSVPNLLNAEIAPGEEAWDEFSETTFKLLVKEVIAEKNGLDISNVYGQWSPPKASEILVHVDSGTKLFVGEAKPGPIVSVEYAELVLDGGLEFYFREFKNPFAKDEDLSMHLDHVAGEYTKGGKYFHVSVPMKQCQFSVRN